MGWKASCILVNERQPGSLGTPPRHDSARAQSVLRQLGLGRYRSRGLTTFDEGIFPESLVIGAYEGRVILGDSRICESCLEARPDPITARVLKAFPDAAVLRVGLNSVVNLWSYAYFEQGALRRAYGGTADHGVVLDLGELLPEERPHFEKSVVRDGQRIFFWEIDGHNEEFTAPAFGETLVFEVMARFLGCRPDESRDDFEPMELPMETFEPAERRRWWWPFSSG